MHKCAGTIFVIASAFCLFACSSSDSEGAGTTASAGGGGAAGAGGMAGAAGTGGGGAGTGGGGAGTGGGGAGTGGGGAAGSAGAPAKGVGAPCTVDSECSGAKCLTASGNAFAPGSPSNGYCTKECEVGEDQCGSTTTCTKGPDGLTYCFPDTICQSVGNAAYCMEGCLFGIPVAKSLTDMDSSGFQTTKCHGRKDVACSFDSNEAMGICVPQCNTTSCPTGKTCDTGTGLCVDSASVSSLKANGSICDSSNSDGECLGICEALYDSNDPNVPTNKKHVGMCIDPCTFGTTQSCGYADGLGVCFYPTVRGQNDALRGPGDQAGCAALTTNGDCGCPWEDGVFSWTVAGISKSVCLVGSACSSDSDCAWSGTGTCRTIQALAGGKYCADHDVDATVASCTP